MLMNLEMDNRGWRAEVDDFGKYNFTVSIRRIPFAESNEMLYI